MMKGGRRLRRAVLLAGGMSLMGFASCLGLDLDRVLRFSAGFAASEFLLDNDAVFDLFEGGSAIVP